ncbi:hypothetical protein ACH5RR_008289 [Cinchona calisaya]|uniref:Uncharacterized protein n=1 Tax=Cinchona calisaya TaxID=153742 RepID=A0ABD3ADV4_9GENT
MVEMKGLFFGGRYNLGTPTKGKGEDTTSPKVGTDKVMVGKVRYETQEGAWDGSISKANGFKYSCLVVRQYRWSGHSCRAYIPLEIRGGDREANGNGMRSL